MTTIVIKNTAHDGYRRAGVAFARGENRLLLETFTQEQIVLLENDPHLFVAIEADDDQDLIGLGQAEGAASTVSTVEHPPGAETALAAVEAPTAGDQILLGSDTLPALIEIGTDQVQLGDIVRIAFDQSELSVEDWNALEPTARDERLMLVIAAARESADVKAAGARVGKAKAK